MEVVRNEDFQNKNNEKPEESEGDEDDESDDMELTYASREALFDPNSKPDLLEEFEIPPAPVAEASQAVTDDRPEENEPNGSGPFDVVLLGINVNPSEGMIFKI